MKKPNNGQDRSFLFVPVLKTNFLTKAVNAAPDVVVLDLEASIPNNRKEEARGLIAEAVVQLKEENQRTFIRINRGVEADIIAAIKSGVEGIIIPCVEKSEHIALVGKVCSDSGYEQSMPIYPIIETPLGLINLKEIVETEANLGGVIYGAEDLVLGLGHNASPCLDSLFNGAWQVSLTANAFGITPYGIPGTIVNFKKLEELRILCSKAKSIGMAGCPVIHPDQVKVVHEVFSPTQSELNYAAKAVREFEGKGEIAIAVDGRMVDYPLYNRFRRMLDMYD